MKIGEYLVQRKIITPSQQAQILEYGTRERLRFGDAGLKLGLLTEESLVKAFGKNYRVDFFHLDPSRFPLETAEILGIDQLLRLGALPLGFKASRSWFSRGRVFNLGLLDPGRADAVAEAEARARKKVSFDRSRVFLILADQFLSVVELAYPVTAAEIARRPASELDPTLAMFLGAA